MGFESPKFMSTEFNRFAYYLTVKNISEQPNHLSSLKLNNLLPYSERAIRN